MVNLYIFNETRRASVYGVGTYIRELTNALTGGRINICMVHLMSDKQEIVIEESGDKRDWQMPAGLLDERAVDYEQQREKYYRNIVFLLKLHIQDTTLLVFHLNFIQHGILAKELKQTFQCQILAVVHHADWAISLMGNQGRLRKILAEKQPDEFEKTVQESFGKEQLMYKTVDRVVCLSQYMCDMLSGECQIDLAKMSVIPNGLCDEAGNTTNRKILRKKWFLSDHEKIILFAGRLDDLKGLQYLIGALRKVLRSDPQCRLIVAGDGTYNTYMKEAKDICTKIVFTGLLEKRDLHELYQIADIGVLPSFSEQCSYVAIEMMMHGLPMITSNAPGLAEMTEDGISALHVPITEYPDHVELDTEVLAEKMLYLLQHPNEAKRLGKNARKRYEERYSGEVFRKNMLDFYQSLYE